MGTLIGGEEFDELIEKRMPRAVHLSIINQAREWMPGSRQ